MAESDNQGAAPETGTGERVDFERAMADLEALVDRLEQGELPLEQAVAEFEKGVALTRRCREALDAAEQKVRMLLDAEGANERLAPFEPEDDER